MIIDKNIDENNNNFVFIDEKVDENIDENVKVFFLKKANCALLIDRFLRNKIIVSFIVKLKFEFILQFKTRDCKNENEKMI